MDHAMNASGWIRVEDACPDTNKDVLVYGHLMRHWDNDGAEPVIAVMFHESDTGKWYGDIDERGYTFLITHWMCLPPAPEEEKLCV